MKKAVIDAIEKALVRKQKQLARIEYEIDIRIHGYSYLIDSYEDAMQKVKEAYNQGNYKKGLQILESYDKKKKEINKILSKDGTELFDKRWKIESEIRELEDELWRLNLKRYV